MPQIKIRFAVVIAITAALHAMGATPAFPQSPASTYISSEDQSNAIEATRAILVGSVAALGLTALGLATALLSGKNKEQLEAQTKTAREIANAAKSSQFALNFSASKPRDKIEDHEKRLNLMAAELIENYHTQALSQATAQFWFSVTAASIGFLVIMYAAFSSFRSIKPQIVLLNTIPGLAIEAVAALFFKQAEDTRKRATELYDRLRSDDKQVQAVTLVESIQNKELRDVVKAQWALQMAGLESRSVDLSSYSPQLPPSNDQQQLYKKEPNKLSATEKDSSSAGQFIR